MSLFSTELAWWITVFDLPAMAGLFWLIWRTRAKYDQAFEALREALSAFKLEVARNYASQNELRALESRLVSHLLRIEAKLDTTALKAEAVHAANTKKP